ncbi:PLP-dependent aminotransferase family protein, partial [Pyxidicoccus sp. 3LFB2]
VGWLPEGVDDRVASARAAQAGLQAYPLSAFQLQGRPRGALLLGYACVPEDELAEGVTRLARALR